MFHVWDGNHGLQAWCPYIDRVHALDEDFHIFVDSFFLNTTNGLVELLTMMINVNK
jgi:hypothetical protein